MRGAGRPALEEALICPPQAPTWGWRGGGGGGGGGCRRLQGDTLPGSRGDICWDSYTVLSRCSLTISCYSISVRVTNTYLDMSVVASDTIKLHVKTDIVRGQFGLD